MSYFDTKPIYLAARFVCQFWDHQKLFASLPANTSSSIHSINLINNSSTSGNSSDSSQNTTDNKTSDPQP